MKPDVAAMLVRMAQQRGYPPREPVSPDVVEFPVVAAFLHHQRSGKVLFANLDLWVDQCGSVDFELSFDCGSVDTKFGYGPDAEAYLTAL